MRVLELFSGTGSIRKLCDKIGFESISVDMILPANHQIDIMDFDYKQYPKDYFDIVWASPPCVEYSRLQECFINRMRKGVLYTREIQQEEMKKADKLVEKALEIIKYFNPEYYFIENPQSGRLKERDIMKGIPFYDVDYCMYSDWGYKKRTRIWTNKENWKNLLCDKNCGNMKDGKHIARIGTSKTILDDGKMIRVNTAKLRIKYKDYINQNIKLNKDTTQLSRYRIPEDLIFSLFLE
tara:strand:- start:1097 stop:1810 length:714 start_codon:yes stop_codon:yes gene_type:complete